MENAPNIHLNPASQTPPVDCPLLIEVDGQLVRVIRRQWARSHNAPLAFYRPDGVLIMGRYRWTYP